MQFPLHTSVVKAIYCSSLLHTLSSSSLINLFPLRPLKEQFCSIFVSTLLLRQRCTAYVHLSHTHSLTHTFSLSPALMPRLRHTHILFSVQRSVCHYHKSNYFCTQKYVFLMSKSQKQTLFLQFLHNLKTRHKAISLLVSSVGREAARTTKSVGISAFTAARLPALCCLKNQCSVNSV